MPDPGIDAGATAASVRETIDLLELDLSAMIRDELKNAGGGETLRPKLAHFAETHGIPV